MPIYEYACPDCGNHFEKMQPISAETTLACPQCGGTAQRKISQSGFVLKGSGFYLTDYVRNQDGRKSGEPASGGSESATSTSADAPASSSSSDSSASGGTKTEASPKSD